MSALDFYRTRGGRVFVDHTVPKIAASLEHIGNQLGQIAMLLERIVEAQATEAEQSEERS